MVTRLTKSSSLRRKRIAQSSRRKRPIKNIYRPSRHPCERCSKKIKGGRYCYSCGHYRLGLF